jgi:anti-anti-sigma regulatory factor
VRDDDSIQQLTAISFDTLLRRSNPFNGGSSVFDLREVRFISPTALVQLAAVAHALAKRDETLTIQVDDADVRTYLVRSGFLNVVAEVATIEPAYDEGMQHRFDHLVGSNPLLLEVTRIDSGEALPPLLDRIVDLLRIRLHYRKRDAFDAVTVISEVAQNTFDHNNGGPGFIALQTFQRHDRGRARFVEIGVADFGAGLLDTLRRNPTYRGLPNDVRAIAAATHLGASQHTGDPTRGTGLHHLLRIAYHYGGSVQIRSGAGKVSYRGDKRQGWQFTVPRMPGVQIRISLRRAT